MELARMLYHGTSVSCNPCSAVFWPDYCKLASYSSAVIYVAIGSKFTVDNLLLNTYIQLAI